MSYKLKEDDFNRLKSKSNDLTKEQYKVLNSKLFEYSIDNMENMLKIKKVLKNCLSE